VGETKYLKDSSGRHLKVGIGHSRMRLRIIWENTKENVDEYLKMNMVM
jgi:hypothetical protein